MYCYHFYGWNMVLSIKIKRMCLSFNRIVVLQRLFKKNTNVNVCIHLHTQIFIMSLVATTGIILVSISEKEGSLSPTFLKKWVRAQSITLEKYSWYVVKWIKASRTVMFIIWPCFCFQMLWEWRFEITATRLLKLIIRNVWIMRCRLLELQFFFLIGVLAVQVGSIN